VLGCVKLTEVSAVDACARAVDGWLAEGRGRRIAADAREGNELVDRAGELLPVAQCLGHFDQLFGPAGQAEGADDLDDIIDVRFGEFGG
jgi:hypothetical protein